MDRRWAGRPSRESRPLPLRRTRTLIFIDTGAFLARHYARDQYHSEALAAWEQLEVSGLSYFTSNFVLDELLTLLGSRTSYHFAAQIARTLFASEILQILRPDSEDELRAIGYFEKFADQRVSFTDCVSFALMKKRRIRRAFSFDRHFALAGFELWPSGWTSVHGPAAEYDAEEPQTPEARSTAQ